LNISLAFLTAKDGCWYSWPQMQMSLHQARVAKPLAQMCEMCKTENGEKEDGEKGQKATKDKLTLFE